MSSRQPFEVSIGDVVRLRKPHPCGGYEWEVFRTGADIGMECLTCSRRVMLPRSKFEKRVKTMVRSDRESRSPVQGWATTSQNRET
jgi:hypothetical protein